VCQRVREQASDVSGVSSMPSGAADANAPPAAAAGTLFDALANNSNVRMTVRVCVRCVMQCKRSAMH
jgi:hypothetical protein